MSDWNSLEQAGWAIGGADGGQWALVDRGGRRAVILEAPTGGFAWAVSDGDTPLGDGYCLALTDAVHQAGVALEPPEATALADAKAVPGKRYGAR